MRRGKKNRKRIAKNKAASPENFFEESLQVCKASEVKLAPDVLHLPNVNFLSSRFASFSIAAPGSSRDDILPVCPGPSCRRSLVGSGCSVRGKSSTSRTMFCLKGRPEKSGKFTFPAYSLHESAGRRSYKIH
ncbi:hypothetical protein RRG08_033724 [Elysia crispata]|uniref:Uncharacterized protein n=1 Tax=Elysia crispata TaxID=231223 RepID=A0AAE1DUQ7_9GAST|nr:hypothetical protein RRG08_033724 [Elysia crispata]